MDLFCNIYEKKNFILRTDTPKMGTKIFETISPPRSRHLKKPFREKVVFFPRWVKSAPSKYSTSIFFKGSNISKEDGNIFK